MINLFHLFRNIGEAFEMAAGESQDSYGNLARYYTYTAVFEPQSTGGYTAYVPVLRGCISQGNTLDEARKNTADGIKLYCESLRADGMLLPEEKDNPSAYKC